MSDTVKPGDWVAGPDLLFGKVEVVKDGLVCVLDWHNGLHYTVESTEITPCDPPVEE